MLKEQYVWDPITRIWHWLLALIVTAGWLIGQFRTIDTVDWHFYLGYATLALLGWRIIWGVIGPEPVRFSALFKSISGFPAYLLEMWKREPSGIIGHNPLGSISVLAILVLLGVQSISGLFIEDDTLFAAGPFAYDIGGDLRKTLKSLHHLCATLLQILVILHLAAIAFYWTWKKENLVLPMITGHKKVKAPTAEDG